MSRGFLLLCISFRIVAAANAQAIVGYYSGSGRGIEGYPLGELTHLVYSFCHLRGGRLRPDSRADSLTILKLTGLKSRYPSLKVLVSLGGWGGCRDCSAVFSTEKGREVFSSSVVALLDSCGADGIDVDWEFPALPAFPGHRWSPADRSDLTRLLVTLKRVLGPTREVSLTAAGFSPYLEGSVDWKGVAGVVDRIQLMTYDMIGSKSKYSGHHSALYSTSRQQESTDRSVRYLDSLGVPLKKVVIGIAFYAREFEVEAGGQGGGRGRGGDAGRGGRRGRGGEAGRGGSRGRGGSGGDVGIGGRGADAGRGGEVGPGSSGGDLGRSGSGGPGGDVGCDGCGGREGEAGDGLFQPAKFKRFVSMRSLRTKLRTGYVNYWDDSAKAPYSYDPVKRSFLTYDDSRSIAAKTRYVREKGLGGVMFWQLSLDIPRKGLLDNLYNGLSRKQ